MTRLEELEKDLIDSSRNAPEMTDAAIALARQEQHYASDQAMKRDTSERDTCYWRGYAAANKKLIRRLTKDTANDN